MHFVIQIFFNLLWNVAAISCR